MKTLHLRKVGAGIAACNRWLSCWNIVVNVMIVAMTITLITSCSDDDDPKSADLTISSITPNTGGAGTSVEINGTGFSTTASENAVMINTVRCTVTSTSETKLTITIPANATTGKITVSVGDRSAEGPVFTFVEALSIESIAPATGAKGTTVTIKGTGFNSTPLQNTVTINDKACQVTNASTTQLSIVIPANAGSGVIKVTVGGVTVQSVNFEFVYTTILSTLAGSSYGYQEGTGSDAKFGQPYNVATDAAGNLYVADTDNHRIRKITPEGVTSTFAGGSQGDLDGTGTEAKFNYPYGVATDAAGNVYVADTHNHKVKKITPAGVVSTVAGSTGGHVDATGANAKFYYLTGLTVDANGNIYVADKDNHKIRKVTPSGEVTTLAGSTSGFADATGSAAQFSQPYDVAVDEDGNVYVADTGNHKIRKVTQAGVVTTFAGSTQGDTNGTGTGAQFSYPYGIAIDADGNLYLADTFNQKVKKVTSGGVVTTVTGTTNGSADGDTATGQFNYLTGVDAFSSGKIYVADKDNHRVRAITID